eukprot:2806148-Karenia_brevis.AAC.1
MDKPRNGCQVRRWTIGGCNHKTCNHNLTGQKTDCSGCNTSNELQAHEHQVSSRIVDGKKRMQPPAVRGQKMDSSGCSHKW